MDVFDVVVAVVLIVGTVAGVIYVLVDNLLDWMSYPDRQTPNKKANLGSPQYLRWTALEEEFKTAQEEKI